MFALDDNRKIGIGLTIAGLGFLFLGVLLFFDTGLIACGNLLFLAGVTLIVGVKHIASFFFVAKDSDEVRRKKKQQRKIIGSSLFFAGVLLVIIGWAKIGILVEMFGFVNIFGDFIPYVVMFARNLPVIGNLLSLPVLKQITDRLASANKTQHNIV